MMNPVEIIAKKRDGQKITQQEIEFFIQQFHGGQIPDYQMSALCMAIYFQGMDEGETAALTTAMLHSGQILDLTFLPHPTVDKHSTGGIGDKVSLPLVPIVACWDVVVPMVAGRGLGHTGGTLDKLEAIAGFNVHLTTEKFMEVLQNCGGAIIGQTAQIAPIDKKLYALRDVTATVPSIPLITASIMSKKLAEGAQSFVFDVKCGRGAFMRRKEDAVELARSLVQTAQRAGRGARAYITSMEQPLGYKIGNWLEVEESWELLNGGGPADLRELTVLFAATMLLLAGKCRDLEGGKKMAQTVIDDGRARAKFLQMVQEQGGDVQMLLQIPVNPCEVKQVLAPRDGYIHAIDPLALGMTVVMMGGGRKRQEDTIDPWVGIEIKHKVGARVQAGEILAKIYYRDSSQLQEIQQRVQGAFRLESEICEALALVLEEM